MENPVFYGIKKPVLSSQYRLYHIIVSISSLKCLNVVTI